jgi:hypothetical protein
MQHPRDVAREKFAQTYEQRLQFHIHNPAPSSPSAYLHSLELELGLVVAAKLRIYLDTKFWVLMRDYKLKRASNPDVPRLYNWLVEHVRNGEVVCPVSAYTVGEVQLQDDETTRLATAQLMDELSASVILQKEETRIPLEVRAFLESSLGLFGGTFELLHHVWTKPPWMIYPYDAGGDDSPPEYRLASRKAAIDASWGCTISDLVAQAPGALPMRAFSEVLAPFLNEEKPTPPEKVRSFEQVFLGQLVNPLEEYAGFIEGALDQVFRETTGVLLSTAEREQLYGRMTVASTIFNAFRDKRAGRHLPFFRILPSILTMYVIDRERRYKPTDFYDFFHAAAALPYCHMYLAENSMTHLLTSKRLSFDRLYDIQILSDIKKAIPLLEDILQSRRSTKIPT